MQVGTFLFYKPPEEKIRNLPPIILLHGLFDSNLTWRPIANTLAIATGRAVYCPDNRNHGDAIWTHHGYFLEQRFLYDVLVDDLFHFMQSNNIQKAILVGHCMGGKIAIHFADRMPERVEKLIVEDMTPKRLPVAVGTVMAQNIRLMRFAINSVPPAATDVQARGMVAGFMVQVMHPADVPRKQECVDTYMYNMAMKKTEEGYRWKANVECLENILMAKLSLERDLTGAYHHKALFFYGNASYIDLENHRDHVLRYFPFAEFFGIDGAGHYIHLNYRDMFIEKLIHFINDG